jgi:hypothetical protein
MNEYEQFAKAFRCSVPMAESIVTRIRQRLGRDVPMSEILATIRKIAPTRLTTDEIVKRMQKNNAARNVRPVRGDEEDFEPEPEEIEAAEGEEAAATGAAKPRRTSSGPRRPTSTLGQMTELLDRNWLKARDQGLRPPDIPTDKFVRAVQATVGEPRPSAARVLQAVQKLSKQDVLITPNLTADEIIETDELR